MLLGGIAALALILAALCAMGSTWWMLPVYFLLFDLAGLGLAFGFLMFICSRVDLDKPQERDSKFYRAAMYLYIDALIVLVGLRMETKGLEKTPKDGRFLLVCNHQNMADPGILLAYFKKSQLAFISKQENRNMFVVGKFMHKIMCQTLDRDNDRQALKTILKCIQLIRDDEVSIGVFPEGYTSKDGKLHHFRSGAFKIAQKTGVPIVVCTLKGTRELFHNLKKLKTTRASLHLVDVIAPEELKGKSTVEIADRVYEMMIDDLGEEFRVTE